MDNHIIADMEEEVKRSASNAGMANSTAGYVKKTMDILLRFREETAVRSLKNLPEADRMSACS
ncbi:MAG: hypothetical protein IJD60_08740 [Clostridia bacterium]|nr:hypothetical protein [Clostridia bacterium]